MVLSGRSLRYALVLELLSHGTLSTRDLVAYLEARGYTVPGRASKTVSDALRWEVRRGRVVRDGRNCYRAGHVAKSTGSYMRSRLHASSDGLSLRH